MAGIKMDKQTIGMASTNRDQAKHMLHPINDIGIIKQQHKQGVNGRTSKLPNNLQRAIQIQTHIPRITKEAIQPPSTIPTPIIPIKNKSMGIITHKQMIKLATTQSNKKMIRHTINMAHNITPVITPILYVSPYPISFLFPI